MPTAAEALQREKEAFAIKPETTGAISVSKPQTGAEYLESLRDDRVPVGVRGHTREQRFAAHVLASDIDEVIAPESLAQSHAWRTTPRRTLAIFRAMDHVARSAAEWWRETGGKMKGPAVMAAFGAGLSWGAILLEP